MAARVVFLLVVGGSAVQAEPLRLSDVLARAEEHGPEQQVASAQIPIARAEARSARMFPNPGFVAGAGRGEPVFNASLQLRLPIFGQREAHVRAADEAVRQTVEEAGAARWRLRHDVRVAYWSVARADEEVAIAAEVEALSRRIADMAKEKLEVGTGTRLDERQASLVHVRAQQEVSDRRAAARVARLELSRQLAWPVDTLGPIADPLAGVGPTPPLDSLLAEAHAQHPDLRALKREREAALARAYAARADRRPAPTLELGVELLDPTTCGSATPCVGPRGALGFDLPLFNWNGGPIERAEAEGRLASLKMAAAETRIDSAVRAAYESFIAARARAQFFDAEYLPSAVEVEHMAREGFAVGRSGILPLIEAERAVLDARLGRAEALYAVQAARADLEEASGVALSTP
jgi:cobalt-zinc-cadmium efflux system outer membrane protein